MSPAIRRRAPTSGGILWTSIWDRVKKKVPSILFSRSEITPRKMLRTVNTFAIRSISIGVEQTFGRSGQSGRYFTRNLQTKHCYSSLATHFYQRTQQEDRHDDLTTTKIRYQHTDRRYLSSNFNWKSKQSPYDLLGVTRSSTAKEIKLAYFREAKKYHPDLNPNNPDAKRKFQEVSAAYELLSDPKRKAMYDATGYTGESHSGGGQHAYYTQQEYAKHAEDIFNEVTNDFDVVKDALQSYSEEMKDEMNYAVDCMKDGDWNGVMDVAKAHKGLIFGIVIPSFLLLRYPPAVFAAMRIAWAGSQLIVAGLVYTGHLQTAARFVWRKIVDLSNEQRERAKNRRMRRQ